MSNLDPLQMLLDAAEFIKRDKPEWAKAARAAVAASRVPAPEPMCCGEHVAWQRRFKSSTTRVWGDWGFSKLSKEEFEVRFGYLVEIGECEVRHLGVIAERSTAKTTEPVASKQLLNEIIAYFATARETPGGAWAHDDALSSYGLDFKAADGTKFWIDLQDDGSITLLWKPAGTGKPTVQKFCASAPVPSAAMTAEPVAYVPFHQERGYLLSLAVSPDQYHAHPSFRPLYAAPATSPAPAEVEALAKGFMTACSGDGEYQIKISFESLQDMQAAHMALCKSAYARSRKEGNTHG